LDSKSEDVRNGIISLVGSLVFVVLTVLVPLVKVLGGFLTYSTTLSEPIGTWTWDLYWDVVRWGATGLFNQESYPNYVAHKAA